MFKYLLFFLIPAFAFATGTTNRTIKSGSVTWTLPTADGTSGQAMTTNGSGTLSFSTISGTSSLVGGITYPTALNCQWRNAAGSSVANFGQDTDCGTATVIGSATAPGTKIPGLVFSSLAAGTYRIEMCGAFGKADIASSVWTRWRFSDGTNTTNQVAFYIRPAESFYLPCLSGTITYGSAQGSTTIQIQGGASGSGEPTIDADANGSAAPLQIMVYRVL